MFLIKRNLRFISLLQFLQAVLFSLMLLVILTTNAKEGPFKLIGVTVTVICICNSAILLYLGIIFFQRCKKLLQSSWKTLLQTISWLSILGFLVGWIPIISQTYCIIVAVITIIAKSKNPNDRK